MSLGAVSIVHQADAVGPVKIRLVSFAGDGAYPAGGSLGFADLFKTCVGGAQEAIVAAIPIANGNVGLEYTAQGEPLPVTAVTASTDLLTVENALSATNPVELILRDKGYGNKLPGGLAEGTVYYVIASGLTTHALKLSATSGGSAIDITDAGVGRFDIVTADKLLARVVDTGVESAVANQSATTYRLLVISE